MHRGSRGYSLWLCQFLRWTVMDSCTAHVDN